MSDNVAILKGYTREVTADAGMVSLNLLIIPGSDYDDTFKAWDMDAQEFILVDGWLFTFETVCDHNSVHISRFQYDAHVAVFIAKHF